MIDVVRTGYHGSLVGTEAVDCVDEDALAALVAGNVAATERTRLERHLAGCDDCRAIVVELARHTGSEDARIGRFELVDVLGAGAMGTVYEARDPQLRRHVALKVLHGATCDRSTLTRIREEGRALARLSHPNIVTVYDVGVDGALVYIAMELVRGQTLERWLEASPRTWREIVRVFVQVAHGLHAAHEDGLVHRDVKPSNILVGDDGRVRVVDFGLSLAASLGDAQTSGDDAFGRTSTRAGARVGAGTPAYMAFEQLAGGCGTTRSDQFSFCVALYEALYRERPYPGRTLPALRHALRHLEVRPPPRRGVPRGLGRIVCRGLSRDPQERWPNMRALADALTQSCRTSTRRRLGVMALGVVAASFTLAGGHAEQASAWCHETPTVFVDELATLRRGFVDVAPEYGARRHAQTLAALQGYAGRWSDAWRSACAQATSAELHGDRRMQCLEEHRAQARGAVAAMQTPTRTLVAEAPRLVAELPRPNACLEGPDEPPADPAVARLRTEIAPFRALTRATLTARQFEQLEALRERARALEASSEEADALRILGVLAAHRGENAEAARLLAEGFYVARAAGDADTAARAGVALVTVLGGHLEQHERAFVWGRHTAAVLEASPDPQREAELLAALAQAYITSHRIGEAKRCVTRGLALLEEAEPSYVEGSLRRDHAEILRMQGHHAQAKDEILEAVRLIETVDGVDAPDLAPALISLATIHHLLGEGDAAQTVMQRAVDLGRLVWGEDDIVSVYARANLAVFAKDNGNLEGALRAYHQVHDDFARLTGPRSRNVLYTAINLASVYADLQRWPQAERWAARARDLAIELDLDELRATAERMHARARREGAPASLR